jgi:hypothetical protein
VATSPDSGGKYLVLSKTWRNGGLQFIRTSSNCVKLRMFLSYLFTEMVVLYSIRNKRINSSIHESNLELNQIYTYSFISDGPPVSTSWRMYLIAGK